MKSKLLVLLVFVLLIFSSLFYLSFVRKEPLSIPPVIEKNEPTRQAHSSLFIFTGDTGTGTKDQYAVGEAIDSYCQTKACEAVFIAGDVIYDEGVASVDDPQFQTKFEKPYESIDLPFYIAFGNHDYLGCTTCYIDYEKNSAKWHMPSSYYSQVYSDVTIHVINTEQFDKTQQEWLQKSLSSSQTTFNIVLGHRPVVTYEIVHHDENWNGKDQLQNIICNSADLYVSGHSHLLEDIGTLDGCIVKQLVSGGGGASMRESISSAPEHFVYNGYGFLSVKQEGSELFYEFINTNREVIFSKRVQ